MRNLTLKKLDITFWLVFLLAQSCCVDAGHSSWETGSRISLTTSSNHKIDRRWLTIEPSADGVHVWPDATIKYCFESEETRQRTLYHLQAARDRWYASGVPERFELSEVTQAECESNRANVLYIRYSDAGRLSATSGVPPLNGKDPEYRGPTMYLSNREDVGTLDVVANYAHELGHAWGLLHEHQNPAFWAMPYTGGQSQIFTFNCHNLKDYTEVISRYPEEEEQLCRLYGSASKRGFSASEYLPIQGATRGPTIAIAQDQDVDWESIMLYPSGAGGVGQASPGNDQRAPVLLKASDGSKLPINLFPSVKDVQALIRLYEIKWPARETPLINEPASPRHSKFKNIFRRNRCL
jgi:hypothetical protein